MTNTRNATTTVEVRYGHVLVPIDGTERSAVALRTGRALASRLGATLHTVSVATEPASLAQLRTTAAAALDVPTTDRRVHVVHSDDPARAIAAVADELGSCIVCMSTHAHDRLVGAVLGSAARELLQQRDRPVVMIGPLADRTVYLDDTWAEPLAIGRVVVCVDADGAPSADGASSVPGSASALVEVAAAWAVALGMTLTLLSVATPEITLSGTVGTDELEHWLTRLAANASLEHHLGVDTHVEIGPVGTTSGVRSYLAAHPAGLLVVSTHARHGVDRIAHGATAAGIIAASTIATLVVPMSGPTG